MNKLVLSLATLTLGACGADTTLPPASQPQPAARTSPPLIERTATLFANGKVRGSLPIAHRAPGRSVPTHFPTKGSGAVLAAPKIFALYWGNFTSTQVSGMQSYLTGLAGYVSGNGAPANQEPTVRQYGVNSASVSGSYTDATVPTGSIGEADVEAKIAALQKAGSIPAFASETVCMVFTSGVAFNDGYGGAGGYCGYHDYDTTRKFQFSLNPYPSVADCGMGGWSGLSELAIWQAQTSHELLEAGTDPQPFNGWTPEIGDECNWGEDASNVVSLSFGAVQEIVDKAQSSCSIWKPAPEVATAGHLWHTLRRANGSWTGLGDVQGQFAIPGPVAAVSAATGAAGETQFMFTTSDGHLWHTLRRANGSWTGLGDVQGQFAIPGPVAAVSATAGAAGETQFMFTTSDGHLWHTLRRANGSWTGLGDVQGQFAIPGPVAAVSAAPGAGGETQYMFTTRDGHLWHTLRRANGSWTGLGDVQGQFAIPGPVTAVSAAAGAAGETQFMFTTSNGHLWHTLRRANGSWTGLGDVQGQFAIPGPVASVSAATGAPGETQFGFTTSDGHLWHTLRRANGSWTGLGDVQGQFAIPGPVATVAGSAGAGSETQFVFTTR